MSPPLAKIQKYNDRYVVFYDKGCPYSERAIELLKDVPHRAYEITSFADKLSTLIDYFKYTATKTGFDISHKTKPIVFYQGKFIGGFTELQKHLLAVQN